MFNFLRGELLKTMCPLLTLHLSQITKSVGIKCRRPKRISSANERLILKTSFQTTFY